MLIAETIILCMLFFIICYCNTGSDEKNIKSFSSYSDEIQDIVRQNTFLKDKIKSTTSLKSLVPNIIVFIVVFFLLGLFMKEVNFIKNFANLLILGQILNLFDFLVIDMLWWQNSKRIRFTGTESMDKAYRSIRKHFTSFIKGILVFLIVALLDGFILSIF